MDIHPGTQGFLKGFVCGALRSRGIKPQIIARSSGTIFFNKAGLESLVNPMAS